MANSLVLLYKQLTSIDHNTGYNYLKTLFNTTLSSGDKNRDFIDGLKIKYTKYYDYDNTIIDRIYTDKLREYDIDIFYNDIVYGINGKSDLQDIWSRMLLYEKLISMINL